MEGRQVGLWVAGQSYLAHITGNHLVYEMVSWGAPRPTATAVVDRKLGELADAIPSAVLRVPVVSDRTVSAVTERIARLRRSL